MKAYSLGFIGGGNMAQAIIKGAVKKGTVSPDHVFVYDIDSDKTKALAENAGIISAEDMTSLCRNSDIIMVAVKPAVMETVLNQIKHVLGEKPLVSIAAGWSADRIRAIIGIDKSVCRLMPNTPLMAGEGMSVFETPCNIPDDAFEFIERLFMSLGRIEHVPASAMDAVTAVSGSGPAYVFMFIEALSDAGVLCGLPRDKAMTLAAQTVFGSAKMVLDSGRHPGALKDAVCSPGGTTIEAVKSLESDGFRGAVIKAVEQCRNKSQSLSEKS